MSRTIRKRKRISNLKPYSTGGRWSKENMHTNRSDKLTIKNANRSKKKGIRQKTKKEINKELNNDWLFFEESWN